MTAVSNNIHPIHDRLVQREERERFLNQRACVFWMTGLSGSGKSTLAQLLERRLFGLGYYAQVLDGDNIRSGINQNLGFSLDDRRENIRRIAEVSKLYVQSGIICINSFVSPTKAIRGLAKHIIGGEDYHEIFVNASLATCEARDVKGLYRKARAGQLPGFSGIDSPFEAPERPDLEIQTDRASIAESMDKIMKFVLPKIQLRS